MRLQKTTVKQTLIILALAAAATLAIAYLNLDRTLSGRYHLPPDAWPLTENQPWRFLYRYGDKLVWALPVAAMAALLTGIWSEAAAGYRRPAIYLLLVALIGPGLLVHQGLKEHWGRARPRNITEFGGKAPFTHPWEPRSDPKGNSFPSGHASWAFYLVSPYFVLRRRKPAVAKAILTGGISYGILMGFARIVQGAHFLSDVLWAGTFVYLTALILADLVAPENNQPQT